MANLAALGTIFIWAFLSFWSALPAGIALGIDAALVALTATVSYGCGAALVVIIGAPLRERLQKRFEKRTPDGELEPPGRIMRLIQSAWDRFGLVGLAALAPLTTGSLIGAAVGLSFGAKPLRLIITLTLGAALWSIVIVLAITAGIMTVSTIP